MRMSHTIVPAPAAQIPLLRQTAPLRATRPPAAERLAPCSCRQGSALILALVVLTVVSTLALTAGMRLRTHWTLFTRHALRNRVRLMAGNAAQAMARVVAADTNGWDDVSEAWAGTPLPRRRAWADAAGWVQSTPQQRSRHDRTLALVDEERALNVNLATPEALAWLLHRVGKLEPAAARDAAAAVMDWRDKDEELTPGGAEAPYYARLSPPRRCPNAPLEDLRELRLIRGISDETFRAIAPRLTLHGDGRINVNTASAEVIEAILRVGGPPEAAARLTARIARFRKGGGVFRTLRPELLARTMMGAMRLDRSELATLAAAVPYLAVESRHFRGYAAAVAAPDDLQPALLIEFIVDRRTGDFVHWCEL